MTDFSHLPLSVLNALPNPVFMIGVDGSFEFANSATETFFRSGVSVLKTRRLGGVFPVGSPVRTLVEQVRQSGVAVSEYRIDLSSPRTGDDCQVDVTVSPVMELSGCVVVVLQVRSTTDALDKQLTHRGSARTVTGLASMLAHEIKNPLSGIRGAAQLLETAGGEDDRVLTRLITEETDRIVRLVDRMEVFSDERPVERDPVNVHAVLDHVKAVAVSGFAGHIEFREHYDPSLPPVPGNRDQLVQVFLNLVKNASEALADRKDPVITLATAFRPGVKISAPGSRERVSLPISLTVSDNGPGISEDIQSCMFDPFVSGKANGSGLGLALVAKIIGDHSGVISCDSQPGETEFEVLLPTWTENRERRYSENEEAPLTEIKEQKSVTVHG